MDNIENNVLANLLASPDNCKLFKEKDLNASYFLYPEQRQFFDILWHHYITYGDKMELDSMSIHVSSIQPTLSEEAKSKLLVFHAQLSLLPIATTFGVLLDEFILNYKTQSLGNSLRTASSLLSDKTPDEAMKILKNEIHTLQIATTKKDTEGKYIGDIDLVKLYEDRRDHPELFRGIELGFPTLDSVLTHKPGTVCLIMGQMKSAKSVLMTNIAHNLITRGKRVYYHVNEGGLDLVINRLVSCSTGLNMTKIERTTLNAEEFQTYKLAAAQYLNNKDLFVDPVASSLSNTDYIANKMTSLIELNGKFDAVLVDYLGLMTTNKPIQEDWRRLGAIALELKDLSMIFQVPVIVLAHVNRKGMDEDKKYFDMSELGLSMEPSKHVDVIASWRIHDTDLFEMTNTGQGTLSVRGSRQSGQKSVELEVDTNKMKIWENTRSIWGAPVITPPNSAVNAGSQTF